MTTPQPRQSYPRPDFERPTLRWTSLNGPWFFLFDDDDVGLSQRWHQNGLPGEVAVAAQAEAPAAQTGHAEGESIVQRVASGTHNLLANNAFAREESAAVNYKRQIQVPFVFQCAASGINDRGVHEVLWYEREVSDIRIPEEKDSGKRVLLRFGAVDYEASVWVNGQHVGGHRGGHVPFDLDITDALNANASLVTNPAGSHRVTIRVFDSAYDLTQPRGKQYWGAKPESIFYTPSGGIWQSVWQEVVPPARIADSSRGTVVRSDDIRSGTLHCKIGVLGRRVGQAVCVEMEAAFGGVVVRSVRAHLSKSSDSVELKLDMRLSEAERAGLPDSIVKGAPLDNDDCWRDGLALWSPEHPLLYDLTIQLLSSSGQVLDTVQTTTGMRSISWSSNDSLWRLNSKPYFQALCLDQGYWPSTFMTPPSQDSLKLDIQLAKKMGMNGCRKHQKVEDPAFYYWADKLGYLVWGEMASAYQFSDEYVERFDAEWMEAVRLVVNRPCVVTWTPVNESWGYTALGESAAQRDHIRSLYYMTRALDPTRSINDNCGWEHIRTDLTTFHDYSDVPDLQQTASSFNAILSPKAGHDMFVKHKDPEGPSEHRTGAPIMCTEFGGVNIAPGVVGAGGDGERGDDWGYTTAKDGEDLLVRIGGLVEAVAGGGVCCAFVYTQLTDVEQETNGLYTFDRKEKLDSAKMKALVDEGLAKFYKRVNVKG